MSKAVKAVGSAVSGTIRSVANVVSGAASALKNTVGQVTGSKFGKILITAAAVYFGGAALAGGMSSSAAGGSFLSGMGTGVANAASSLSTAWGSAMSGNFSGAGSALSSGFQGQAAGSAANAAAQPALSGVDLGGVGGSPATMPAQTGGLVNSAMTTPAAGGDVLTNKGMYDAMTGAAKVTAGTQLAGSVISGIGAQKAAQEQRDYEAEQAALARGRYNENVGAALWSPNQTSPSTGIVTGAMSPYEQLMATAYKPRV